MILEKILNVSNSELDFIDTQFTKKYETYTDICFMSWDSGREHYRLLMYVSSLFDNQLLFDVGTNRTMSAIALSQNKTNKVRTFDVVKVLDKNPEVENIEYVLGNCTEDPDIINTPFIFLDVNHDGLFEIEFYNHLKKINYKGMLMLDDIHLNEPMKDYWNQFKEPKYDLTAKGHWSGTGLVIFE
jgi:hypothetical protein